MIERKKSKMLMATLMAAAVTAAAFACALVPCDSTDAENYGTPTTIDIAPGMSYSYTPTFSLPQNRITLTIHEQDGTWFTIQNGKTLYGTIGTTTGNYNVVLKAQSSNPTQIQYQHIIFNVKNKLAITNTSLPNAAVGSPYNATLTANLTGVTWEATNLPNGLSINPSTGKITGTPTAAGDKNVVINVTATSPTQSASKTLQLKVLNKLTITGGNTLAGAVGMSVTLSPSANVSGGTWSISSGSVPGLSINSSTGVLTLAPTQAISESTSTQITIKVVTSNPTQTATKNITVTVDPQMVFTSVPTADMIIYEV